jgi:aspartokinase/homoserine dehydrogenase 1
MPQDCAAALEAIGEEFAAEISDGRIGKPVPDGGKAILAVVGERMKHRPGISGRIFHALGSNGINVSAIAQGSSELNVSAVVDSRDEAKALCAVHEAFFLAGTRSVNVFIVGCGLIGGTLLEQIRSHRTILFREYSIRVNVVGIANSRRMLTNEGGIDLEGWRARLDGEGQKTEMEVFLARARAMNLPNAVFVDCTASDEVPKLYATLLRSSIAIVTPNKKGNSGPMARYNELMDTVRETGSSYLYETTAGAGLPVISTLHDLQVSGDRIVRIDAVLSGTIGYVLSNYSGKTSMSRLVRKARELGYTEPDPRDDLGASDCARKALILAREAGLSLEYEDIAIEPLVSEACMRASGIEAFFSVLQDEEESVRARYEETRSRGKSLVYAATIDDKSIRLGLRETVLGDALHGLRDAENVVAFTTERYATMPLIIRGPGAGGAVTAGGLFADIVRVARSQA